MIHVHSENFDIKGLAITFFSAAFNPDTFHVESRCVPSFLDGKEIED